MNELWYSFIYHMNSGNSINWFNGDFNFTLDFINRVNGETIGNILMFLPFGILYPLSQKKYEMEIYNFKRNIIGFNY